MYFFHRLVKYAHHLFQLSKIKTNLLFVNYLSSPYFVNSFNYVQDEYGHPELRIERTRFRFWIYPSYWRYFLNRALDIGGARHRNKVCRNQTVHCITSVAPGAGIGHQLACWNTALIFSLRYNLNFVHHPLHSSGNDNWENFLEFGEGELSHCSVVGDNSVKIVNLPRIWRIDREDIDGHRIFERIVESERLNASRKILFQLNSDHFAYDQTVTSEVLRKKYWNARAKNPIDSVYREDKLNIACHVRRGDIVREKTKEQDFENLENRWLDNMYFINVINNINEILNEHTVDIHVFSQGSIAEFSEFEELKNVTYHLDLDACLTFHHMATSNILILSPSSFSYKAGMISTGIKIARYPWWHEIPEDSEWIRSSKDGNFSPKPLAERYLKL